jgi:iron complex transport system ATP-binding protein
VKRIVVGIKGVEGRIEKSNLIINSENPLKTLSSSIVGGGFNKTKTILNHQVGMDFSNRYPAGYLRKVALHLGITGNLIGVMTAADVNNFSVKYGESNGLKVAAIITGGVSNSAAAGEKIKRGKPSVGTINSILLIDGRLSNAAMAGTFITATEAKTRALRELKVKLFWNRDNFGRANRKNGQRCY